MTIQKRRRLGQSEKTYSLLCWLFVSAGRVVVVVGTVPAVRTVSFFIQHPWFGWTDFGSAASRRQCRAPRQGDEAAMEIRVALIGFTIDRGIGNVKGQEASVYKTQWANLIFCWALLYWPIASESLPGRCASPNRSSSEPFLFSSLLFFFFFLLVARPRLRRNLLTCRLPWLP